MWTELDTDAYQILHHQLLHKPTRRELQLQNTLDSNDKILRRRQRREQKNQILIHHTFESGPLLEFMFQYRQIWNKAYVESRTPISKPRLVIGTTNNMCLQSLFVWKKPNREMLIRMEHTEQIPPTKTSR